MAGTLALTVGPTSEGWAIFLTNGVVVARFHGPWARRRALRHLARTPVAELLARR
jgi:hypothetical protein